MKSIEELQNLSIDQIFAQLETSQAVLSTQDAERSCCIFVSEFPTYASGQILLNNLLYDLLESTIPTDNVDCEYVAKPRRMSVSYIRRYI
jgi:hypothetical protein